MQSRYDISDVDPSEASVDRSSVLASALTSGVFHMLVVILLGVLFANIESKTPVEIKLALESPRPVEQLDELRLDTVEVSQESKDAEASTSLAAAIPVVKPTLFDLWGQEAGQQSTESMQSEQSDSDQQRNTKSDDYGLKGEFFGATAYGSKFVYVLDMSTSMGYPSQYGRNRFQVAAEELLDSIDRLDEEQSFYVILFCYQTRFMFDVPLPEFLPATQANKRQLHYWLRAVILGGGTDPRFGVMAALRMKPDAIFLLSDGEFNGRGRNLHRIPGDPPVEKLITSFGPLAAPIHTIAFEDTTNRRRLRGIAHLTNATHRFVGSKTNQELLIADLGSSRSDDVALAMKSLIDDTVPLTFAQRKLASKELIKMLGDSDPKLRAMAILALRSISDGNDFGPDDEHASRDEFRAAQRRWTTFWEDAVRSDIDWTVPDLANQQ